MLEAEWSIYLLLMTCQLDLDIIEKKLMTYLAFKCKVPQAGMIKDSTSASQILCRCLNQAIKVLCISGNCPLPDAMRSCLLTGCVMCKIVT